MADVTNGAWGLSKDREWLPDRTHRRGGNRVVARQGAGPDRRRGATRFLADHDDPTGVYNRALLAHLDDRLRPRRRGPVAVLYLSILDRLEAVNDYLGHNAGTGSSGCSPTVCWTRSERT